MERAIHGSGSDDATVAHADVLHAVGDLCMSEGGYAAARDFYTQSLAMKRSAHGSGPNDATVAHPDIEATLHALGDVCKSEGAYAAAHTQSLAMERAIHGSGLDDVTVAHPGIAVTRHAVRDLARVRTQQHATSTRSLWRWSACWVTLRSVRRRMTRRRSTWPMRWRCSDVSTAGRRDGQPPKHFDV
jgi:hypothetical protein